MYRTGIGLVAGCKLLLLQRITSFAYAPKTLRGGAKRLATRFALAKRTLRPHLDTNRLGGAERDRTADPLLAKQVLSQLSYSPISRSSGRAECVERSRRHQAGRPSPIVRRAVRSEAIEDRDSVRTKAPSAPGPRMVGPGRLELPTSRLSGVRSNHLSYGPIPGRTRPRAGFVILLKKEKRGRRASPSPRGCKHLLRRLVVAMVT